MYKWSLGLTLPAFLLCAALLSCSHPAVKHTSISGEVKNTAGWQVLIEDITEIPNQGSPDFDAKWQKGLLYREKATTEYLHKVIEELRDRSLPVSSRQDAVSIKMKINWHDRQVITPQPRIEEKIARKEDRQRAGSIRDDSLAIGLDDVALAFLPENHRVNRVEIDLLDTAAHSLGKVFIGERVEGQVKPEFVAGVIAKILRDGKY